MMKEHNENMGQIRDQMKNDHNKHLNIMNNLNEEYEKEKQKNNEELQKENIKFQEKMKILEEKQENINKNHEIAIKRINEDIEKKKIVILNILRT